MKKHLALLLLAGLCMSSAQAQWGKATTKQECNRRCVAGDADNPKKALHLERLAKIRANLAAETDPGKKTNLVNAQTQEIERHQDELENTCRMICRHNPEESEE